MTSESGGRFWRRHKILTTLLVVVLLIAGAVVGGGLYLNHKIDKIPRFQLHVPGHRPAQQQTGALNILLAGADHGDGKGVSIAQAVQGSAWRSGEFRSDTIMLLHLTKNRKHAYLISVPRDTYVHIDGHGMQKINAAFSFGGPSLYVHTLEQLTRLRVDHLAIIDWNGFRDLSTALGGVRVYIPEDSYDSSQKISWHQGWQTVKGRRALAYVRQRHGLPRGDFDRIRRQQNFLRAALTQAADKGNLTNPIRFNDMLSAVTENLTVDSGLDNGTIRGLARSLHNLRAKDFTFIQLPFGRFQDTAVGSVVIPKPARTRELFRAAGQDRLGQYVRRYGGSDVLAAPTKVD